MQPLKKMKPFRLILLMPVFFFGAGIAFAATPPAQPTTGPGSSEYSYAAVVKNVYGEGDKQYWIFEPADPTPSTRLPLIVFNHGWGGTNPATYGAWIEHIVRRGNVVVFPIYQDPGKWRYDTHKITANAIEAVQAAIRVLEQEPEKHAAVDLSKFAVVGHSAGGNVTANMSGMAGAFHLPSPKAMMCVQPGKSWGKTERMSIPLEGLSTIPAEALLLVVVGDQDRIAGDQDAKNIYRGTPQIPAQNKDFIILHSDDHGTPGLSGDHFAPVAVDKKYSSQAQDEKKDGAGGALRSRIRQRLRERIQGRVSAGRGKSVSLQQENGSRSANALDYYGLWKLFDGLCDAAFYGKNREYALGNTPAQRFMGKWSDGVPVKELTVTDNP